MPPLKKARHWRLHVLGQDKKTYILDNIFLSSLVANKEAEHHIRHHFSDFTRTEMDRTGQVAQVADLLQYCDEIIPYIAEGRANSFIRRIQHLLRKHERHSSCYLRMQTEEEQNIMLARDEKRSARSWGKPYHCSVCGIEGKLYGSPWGTPSVLALCRKHLYLLFFNSTLFSAIVIVALGSIACLVIGKFLGLSPSIAIASLLLIIRLLPLWKMI